MKDRHKCRKLSVRQARYLAGVTAGKTAVQSAREAGYSESYALARSYAIKNHPLVQSELTKALEEKGITLVDIVKPIVDGLKATLTTVVDGAVMLKSQFPDHKTRLAASDRAVKLLGGIPKVGESIPAANGLNLFVSVAQQTDRQTPIPILT